MLRKIRFGIIGSGGIAYRRTIPAILNSENAQLVAVMDRDAIVADNTCKMFSAKRAYYTEEQLLADEEIDAVYIATPVFCHKQQAELCLKYGKHVLIEKPMSMNHIEAQEILDKFKSAGLFIMIGYMMRYHNLHKQIKSIIENNELGQVVNINSHFSCWYPDITGAWRQDITKSGGGVIMDLAVHCIDIIQFVTGAKITSTKSILGTKTFNYKVEDTANILFELDNGTIGNVSVNFNVPDIASQSRLAILGTKGTLIADGTLGQTESGRLTIIKTAQGGYDAKQDVSEIIPQVFFGNEGNLYTQQIDDFCKTIITKNFNYSFAEDSVYIQKICDNIYKSNN